MHLEQIQLSISNLHGNSFRSIQFESMEVPSIVLLFGIQRSTATVATRPMKANKSIPTPILMRLTFCLLSCFTDSTQLRQIDEQSWKIFYFYHQSLIIYSSYQSADRSLCECKCHVSKIFRALQDTYSRFFKDPPYIVGLVGSSSNTIGSISMLYLNDEDQT